MKALINRIRNLVVERLQNLCGSDFIIFNRETLNVPDPYGEPGRATVIGVSRRGLLVEEYEEPVEFDSFYVEDLIAVLEILEKEVER